MAKKSTKAATQFTVTVTKQVPTTITGTLIEDNDTSLVVKVKKPRSSKYVRRVFDKNIVIGYTVSEEDISVVATVPTTVYEVFGTVEVNNGMIFVTDEDGDVTCIASSDNVTIESEPEDGDEKKEKKDTKKTGKKVAKKVVEDEDDDDEDEEEEEEEEAPKKAKGKGKKKVEEDDDDEDEDDDDEDEEDEDEEEDDDDWDEEPVSKKKKK